MEKRQIIEAGPGIASGLRDLFKYLNLKTASAGLVAAIFGCSGPALIVIGAANKAGLSNGQTVAWLFAIYFLGGLISLFLALRYKQPVTGAYSIPGAALVAGSLAAFSFDQAVGAFIMAGIIVFLLGISGLIGKVMRWLPMPIVMAMIAGALIRFATGAVSALGTAPIIAGAAIVAFFVSMRFVKTVPPVLAAFVVGLIAAFATGSVGGGSAEIAFVMPEFTAPTFTLDAFLAISVPLALLVIGAENAQATGVLMAEGYRPPINMMTIISGIGGIAAGFLGGHNANIAGPMTAICSSEQAGEDKEGRYAATVVNGILFGAFGLVAGAAVPVVMSLPGALIGTVAGLAMIGVLLAAFQNAFGRSLGNQTGAFVALAVAMSNISLMGISAPFWALVAGVVVSFIVERDALISAQAAPSKAS
ncbi:benzoate/H(+) symporter BenE family transporter [Nitratireductor indicus]|uniref:Benzoate transporter n=1 Tax=Nitratireductor indicus C115 TaxID=1231190 RepID=K2NXN4_9HYPH|nr:benzoate/H(+) symporter BenE family transporter [Nitratireductor indicus]EKF42654.1 benzoate transporter [Nitratireductor indicus C115]MDS1134977.1 benzoate/H(+) symporter BenE family transporter [Nitratireductor indicus]SFQ38320.1 benzoate membrane transport protein [Nitratireductor indicus]